uniref:Uncharacterized protein n=1 Tax=Tetranychus urticae TaxID=32264 RepID=T1JSU0_TETUR
MVHFILSTSRVSYSIKGLMEDFPYCFTHFNNLDSTSD